MGGPEATQHALPASAAAVAAEIRRRQPGVGRAKLHKLLYYVQGHHLVWQRRPAFADDIEAWEKGPVVGSLWNAEKYQQEPEFPARLPDTAKHMVSYVMGRYGNRTGAQLIESTHQEDPWLRATSDGRIVANQVISHQSLADFFSTESPELRLMREALAKVRDDSPFVPDPPGALEALISEYESVSEHGSL